MAKRRPQYFAFEIVLMISPFVIKYRIMRKRDAQCGWWWERYRVIQSFSFVSSLFTTHFFLLSHISLNQCFVFFSVEHGQNHLTVFCCLFVCTFLNSSHLISTISTMTTAPKNMLIDRCSFSNHDICKCFFLAGQNLETKPKNGYINVMSVLWVYCTEWNDIIQKDFGVDMV